MGDNLEAVAAALRPYVGRRYGTVFAWDAVNAPMIRQWCEALDFDWPAFTDAAAAAQTVHGGLIAPASMLPVWLMPGLRNARPPGSDTSNNREIMTVLEQHGFVGILGTNCEQEYERPLRLGERLSCTFMTEAVSDPKTTRFGPGFFITFLQEYHDAQGALVGTMRLRILRYQPLASTTLAATPAAASSPSAPGAARAAATPTATPTATPAATPAATQTAATTAARPQPVLSPDTAFFWEGLQAGQLLIQRCSHCGTLRHPPGPACMHCHSLEWDTLRASGRGRIASFVVVHKPATAGFDTPNPVGLIDLEEGVRLVAPLIGRPDRRYAIGMAVEAVIEAVIEADCGDYRLPSFRPTASPSPEGG